MAGGNLFQNLFQYLLEICTYAENHTWLVRIIKEAVTDVRRKVDGVAKLYFTHISHYDHSFNLHQLEITYMSIRTQKFAKIF